MVERAAGRQYVGVKAGIGCGNVQPHIAHEGTARTAGEVLAKRDVKISRDRHMSVISSSCRKHFTVQVLVAVEPARLPSQIVGCAERTGRFGLSQGDASMPNRQFVKKADAEDLKRFALKT